MHAWHRISHPLGRSLGPRFGAARGSNAPFRSRFSTQFFNLDDATGDRPQMRRARGDAFTDVHCGVSPRSSGTSSSSRRMLDRISGGGGTTSQSIESTSCHVTSLGLGSIGARITPTLTREPSTSDATHLPQTFKKSRDASPQCDCPNHRSLRTDAPSCHVAAETKPKRRERSTSPAPMKVSERSPIA
jgi:hypothetical protein